MGNNKDKYERAYAIIRFDCFLRSDGVACNSVTVKRIMWNDEEAEREVERLNGLRDDNSYFLQMTRVDRRVLKQ